MGTWVGLTAVVLLAVLVIAAVPALIQLRRTLRSAELLLESNRPRLERALDEASQVAETVNRTAQLVERGTARVSHLVEAASGLAETLERAGETVRSAGTTVSAVFAGLAAGAQAFGGRKRTREAESSTGRPGNGGPAKEDEDDE